MMRTTALPASERDRIRRERSDPRTSQWDYLHLQGLNRALREQLAHASGAAPPGPALDIYCGTQPYRELVPRRPLWGLDIDGHFGAADIVGNLPLPMAQSSFALVLCTQSIQLLTDPHLLIDEMRRVLMPGGYAIVSVPALFPREDPGERRFSPDQLRGLFSDGWTDVHVVPAGGPVTGLTSTVGRLGAGAARRWRTAARLLPVSARIINGIARPADRVTGAWARRWPDSLVLRARRGGRGER